MTTQQQPQNTDPDKKSAEYQSKQFNLLYTMTFCYIIYTVSYIHIKFLLIVIRKEQILKLIPNKPAIHKFYEKNIFEESLLLKIFLSEDMFVARFILYSLVFIIAYNINFINRNLHWKEKLLIHIGYFFFTPFFF